jgi:16S rRNA processing protein RimM
MAPSKRGRDPTPASEGPGRLTVGLVRGLRGLRGHVRIELLTDRPEERFGVGDVLFVEGTSRPLTIVESSAVADGPGWWLRFAEVPDREAADALRDAYLEIDPPDEPREAGRWYFHELQGLQVRGSDGTDLGRVVDVYRAGGAEVFLVRGPRGEVDVPGVKGIVLDLAPDRGEMIVDMEALALDARPVDDDYVRPRDRRPANPRQPKAAKPPRQPSTPQPAAAAQPGKPGRKASAKDEGTRALTPAEIEAALADTTANRPAATATQGAAAGGAPAEPTAAPADPEPATDAG